MNRRDFLAASTPALAAALFGCTSTRRKRPTPAATLYEALVAQNDARVSDLLERQQRAATHPGFGGVPDRHGLYHAGSAAGFVRDLAAAYVAPESRHAGSRELVARMAAAARFLLAAQHEDGTIDLLTTNFHSPPDTGFVLEPICGAVGVLRGVGRPELADLLDALDAFIVRGADALAVGGVHTPNHRWVVGMALARANSLHPSPRYVARIDEWLAEKIDIDPDGQFTERSTAIYSPLCDRCLITIARLLGRPDLLEPVRRNLEMTLYYVHADGEVATEGSRRQDQYRPGSLAPYHYPYRYLAQQDGNGRFAAMARWIEDTAKERLTGNLLFFHEDPRLREAMPPNEPLPVDYERRFAHSNLVRIRRGPVSATIIGDNPVFFSFHKGRAAVALRFASAFFGKGQFVGQELRREGREWVMHQELTGPYYQPLPPGRRPGDGDWAKMPRELRPQSEVQHLRSEVRIREEAGGFAVAVDVTGTDRVPVAMELGFRPGGRLEGVRPVDSRPDAYLLEGGPGRFYFGGDVIEFGPGRAEHRWVELRGALPKLDADSVYLTGQTPFRVRLRLS